MDPVLPPGFAVRKLRIPAAVLLGLMGLVLPAHGLSLRLAEAGSARQEDLLLGFWLFKVLLVIHAAFLLFGPRLLQAAGPGNGSNSPRTFEPSFRYEGTIVLAVLGAALALRLYGLDRGLWYDEIQTLVDYVRLPVGRLLTTYDSQNQHLFYSFLANLSVSGLGESALALRLPAALLGVASLAAIYVMAIRVTARREAVLATALLAFSYHHVWFSQNARGYTGLLFWTILGTLFFLRILEGERSGWLLSAYALSMAFAVYTHLTAGVVVASHAVVWLVHLVELRRTTDADSANRWFPLSAIIVAGSLTLLLYGPVIPQLKTTVLHPASGGAVTTEWQNPLWLLVETADGLRRGLPGGWLTVAGGTVVCALGFLSYWRRNRRLALLMTLPVLLTAAAVLAMRHNLWPRFFFFGAGFAALLVLRGVFDLSRRLAGERGERIATGMLVLVIGLSGWTVRNAWVNKQDYGGAREFVRSNAGPDDAITVTDLTTYPLQRYYSESWPSVTSAEELEDLERTHPRVWILYTFPVRLQAVSPGLWQRINRQYDNVASFYGSVAGGTIVIMRRNTGGVSSQPPAPTSAPARP